MPTLAPTAQTRRPREGFSLLEVMISIVLLVVIFGVTMRFTLRGQELARNDSRQAVLEAQTMRIVEQMVDDIRKSGASQIVPSDPLGNEVQIDFNRAEGLDPATGTITYSTAPLTYMLVEGEDRSNTIDDDGDGVINEWKLVKLAGDLTDPANRSEATIADGVKGYDASLGVGVENMTGFRVRRISGTNRLRIGLTMQRVDRWGKLYEAEYTSSVTLRN